MLDEESDTDYVKGGDEVKLELDALQPESRSFYEKTYFKNYLSLLFFALTLFYLGACSQSGGQSDRYNYLSETQVSNELEDAYESAASGYGFASFCFIIAAACALSAAIIISPYMCGSKNEYLMLRGPFDLTQSSSA